MHEGKCLRLEFGELADRRSGCWRQCRGMKYLLSLESRADDVARRERRDLTNVREEAELSQVARSAEIELRPAMSNDDPIDFSSACAHVTNATPRSVHRPPPGCDRFGRSRRDVGLLLRGRPVPVGRVMSWRA